MRRLHFLDLSGLHPGPDRGRGVLPGSEWQSVLRWERVLLSRRSVPKRHARVFHRKHEPVRCLYHRRQLYRSGFSGLYADRDRRDLLPGSAATGGCLHRALPNWVDSDAQIRSEDREQFPALTVFVRAAPSRSPGSPMKQGSELYRANDQCGWVSTSRSCAAFIAYAGVPKMVVQYQ